MAQLLSQVAVGTLVKLNESGSPVEFYVAKHDYESSLNGAGRTLVVRKDTYDDRVWDSGNVNAYASSDLDSWFNSTYKNMLDADIRSLIGTTKIRYTPGNGNNTVGTLERAIFALSLTELGQSHTYANTEGSALPIASTLRIAYRNGSATTQWTRSPYTGNTNDAWGLNSNGNIYSDSCINSYGSRPAFTLPGASSYVDDNNNVITNQPPTAPETITVPSVGSKGGSLTVSWTASTDPDGNLSGYTLQRSVNGGGFTQVYQGASTSYTDTAPTNADTLQYRVQAYDTQGATSGWTTSDQFPVYGVPTLTVPQMVMQGQQAAISWTAVEGADSYTLQRKANTDADWTQVYSGANLSYTETVGTWTSLQYRVRAVFGSTNGGWATSGDIQIVSASALVISGSDGDLGILTNDVQYSISSDQTSPTIDVTVEVNGGEYASFQATSGQTYSVSVLDLPTGTGSVVITATTEVSSSPVIVTRTWTYSKTAPTFAEQGGLAQLTQQGANIWPKTIAEAVRAPGLWGGNLGLALGKLAGSVLYNRNQVAKYSEVTVNLANVSVGQEVNLPYNGQMVPHIVVHIGNPSAALYDASCDGVWMLRKDIVENGQWNSSGVNTLAGSTIMTTMAGYVANYDSAVQAAIKTVKIPYVIGGGNWAVNSGANGLECKVFPLGVYEVGFTPSDNPYFPTNADGAKLAYFESGHGDEANNKRKANFDGAISRYWLRGPTTDTNQSVAFVSETGAGAGYLATTGYGILPCFILPSTFTATYYVDQDGTVHDSQEYEEAGTFTDISGGTIPMVSIETGSYVGTGTYGSGNPNTLTFPFDVKMVLISAVNNTASNDRWGLFNIEILTDEYTTGAGNQFATIGSSASVGAGAYAKYSNKTLTWYHESGAGLQINTNNMTYRYVAIG